MSKKNKTFEDSLKRLQEISEFLEGENISLEESLNLYEEGVKLSKQMQKTLENAELKIEELNNTEED
jgi:exodeoxyribonuclease VII small subunit